MGRDTEYPPTLEQIENAEDLLQKLSLLEEELNVEFVITGGYRPEAMIEDHMLPGCPHDAHSKGQGIDLRDIGLIISNTLIADQNLLIKYGLWMEDPSSSKDHLHLQTYPPGSGKRIFIA